MNNREFGTFPVSANYEPRVGAPFDARTLVNNKTSLIDLATWLQTDGGIYLYDGLIVSVAKDENSNNNGLYFLNDAASFNKENSWSKLALDSQIIALQDQINNIKTNANSIDVILNNIEELPEVGEDNTTYYIINNKSIQKYDTEKKQYLSFGGLPIALQLYYEYKDNSWQLVDQKARSLDEVLVETSITTQNVDGKIIPVNGTAGLMTPEEKFKLQQLSVDKTISTDDLVQGELELILNCGTAVTYIAEET